MHGILMAQTLVATISGDNPEEPEDAKDTEKQRRAMHDRDFTILNVPASLTVAFIIVYLTLGALMFAAFEGWTILEGVYFCFVTLSTIGFGDYYPVWHNLSSFGNILKLLLSLLYIVLGLAVLSMSLNLMMEEIISKIRRAGQAIGLLKKEQQQQENEEGSKGKDDHMDGQKN